MFRYGRKIVIGWMLLIAFALLPVAQWYFLGSFSRQAMSFWSITHALGQVSGLIGMTLFAITFVLSTRWRFLEDIFGGLDKVYRVHKVIGISAMIFILMHPFFLLIKFFPDDIRVIRNYMFPSIYPSVNLGIVALGLMLTLIILTFIKSIRYHIWKFTHEFMGIAFILAILHIFLVRGTVASANIFDGYLVYAYAVSLVGITAFVYSLVIRRFISRHQYRIEEVKSHGGKIHEITLAPKGDKINFEGGQFVLLSFHNERTGREYHPFSIASGSKGKLKVAAKNLGDFTGKLSALQVGDKTTVEGPYGRFPVCNKGHNYQIWIAGGIGITPFLGMAEDFRERMGRGKRDLYYSVNTEEELIGVSRLRDIEKSSKGFRLFIWITEEQGFLSVSDIKRISGNLRSKAFFICGPDSMKESIQKGLLSEGIGKEMICEEYFRFR